MGPPLMFFHNYSTFLGRKGLYLEDLFVRPEHRGQGVGGALLARVTGDALDDLAAPGGRAP